MRGIDLVCSVLTLNGTDTVFGVPGTQNIALFDAIRQAGLRCVTTTNEMSAAFAVNGYARGSGRCGVLITIPGPGFTYALTGIAEARLDSVPLVWLIGEPVSHPTRKFQLQQLEQQAIASPLVKSYLRLTDANNIEATMKTALALATSGEPGPVIVELGSALSSPMARLSVGDVQPEPVSLETRDDEEVVTECIELLRLCKKPVLLLGQGAQGLRQPIQALTQQLRACVITTTSGRGVISEADERVLRTDLCSPEVLNELLAQSDLVLGLGVKLSHNGSLGFGLKIPSECFIHVDSSAPVLDANYQTRLAINQDVGTFLECVAGRLDPARTSASWSNSELAIWQDRLDTSNVFADVNPVLPDMKNIGMAEFFTLLRSSLPEGSQLITDSGMHQMLARRHYPVYEERGLLVPTDFQSMGYAIPGGIGAKVANPGRPVAVLVGDGGLAINGLELLTAVRNRLALPVIVFVDGHFGLIRHQQVEAFGRTTEIELQAMNLNEFAKSIGAAYARADEGFKGSMRRALDGQGPTIIEARLKDSRTMAVHRAKRAAVETAYRRLGSKNVGRLKRLVKKIKPGGK